MSDLGVIAARLRAAGIESADEEAVVIAGCSNAEAVLERRLAGEPLGLIVGTARFFGLELELRPGVLAPRPETELVAHAAVALAPKRVVDMCCGAGNLACAIASALPAAAVWAADSEAECVELARANAARLGLRIAVHQGDLFAALPAELAGTIDVIVCNPPYISTGKLAGERAPLLRFEPRAAFDAGPYGLAIHQRVIQAAPALLAPGGWLIMEHGLGQQRQIEALLGRAAAFDAHDFLLDGAGVARAVRAHRKD